MIKNKALIVVLFCITLTSLFFWTQLRYPRLHDKTDMMDRQVTTVIYSDTIYPIFVEDSEPVKILKKTANWAYTNWRGMTYGFILASLISCLMQVIRLESPKNRFLNSITGIFLGAPQGVCANCATPIGEAFRRLGYSPHLYMTLVMSSPTLNVLSLSIIISLFPWYVSLFYLSYLLIFFLFVLPAVIGKYEFSQVSTAPPVVFDRWLPAIQFVATSAIKQFLNLLKKTLPIMVFAGLVGTVVVHYIPLNVLNTTTGLSNYFLIALMATLLPVPMLFDIIFVHHIMGAGASTGVSLIALFCLSIFSIYPLMHFYKYGSKIISLKIFATVVIAGSTIGIAFDQTLLTLTKQYWGKLDQKEFSQQLEKYHFSSNTPQIERIPTSKVKLRKVFANDEIELHSLELNPRKKTSGIFLKQTAEVHNIPYSRIPPYFEDMAPNGMAVGDLNNDHYPDLLTPTENGLAIHINMHDLQFESFDLPIDLNGKSHYVSFVALFDYNNDGWLDILATTYLGHVFIQISDRGQWSSSKTKSIYQLRPGPHVMSASFADYDLDGDLDIYLGVSTTIFGPQSDKHAKNVFLVNESGAFVEKSLRDELGPTLSVLFYDFNDDQHMDLYVSNDLLNPDNLFLSNGKEFQRVKKDDNLIPATPFFAMGLDIADFNNDLELDIVSAGLGQSGEKYPMEICDKENPLHKNLCSDLYYLHMGRYYLYQNVCDKITDPLIQLECRSSLVIQMASQTQNVKLCDVLKQNTYLYHQCTVNFELNADSKDFIPSRQDLPQQGGSVLLKGLGKGHYEDVSQSSNYGPHYFRWNSRFIDINNDGWRDIYTSTNPFLYDYNEPNLLFMNKKDGTFDLEQEKYQLHDPSRNFSFTFADFDLDGDLDIFLKRVHGKYYMYENQVNENNSVYIALEDSQNHPQAIGAKVYIKYGEHQQVAYNYAGGGFKSFQSPNMHFGIGTETEIQQIKVVWADGDVSELNQALKANSLYKVIRK